MLHRWTPYRTQPGAASPRLPWKPLENHGRDPFCHSRSRTVAAWLWVKVGLNHLGWLALLAAIALAGCSGGEKPASEESPETENPPPMASQQAAEGQAGEAPTADPHSAPSSPEEGGPEEPGQAEAARDEAPDGQAPAHEAEAEGAAERFAEATYMVPPDDLRQFLVIVSGACQAGLAAEQIRQAENAAAGMGPGDFRQLSFPVTFRGETAEFEVTLFMDDPDVLEVILFGPPALIGALGDLADEAVLAMDLHGLQ